MKSVMDIRKAEEKKQFLKLSPLERIETMHSIVSEIISLRARAESVSEYEIYKRYLKNKKAKTFELAKRVGRDKKLDRLLAPEEKEVQEMPEELI